MGAAKRNYPHPSSGSVAKSVKLQRRRRAKRSYSTFKVGRGGSEDLPVVQSKEQWLRFAGAAVKRYPHQR